MTVPECPLRASVTFVQFGVIVQDRYSSTCYLPLKSRTGVVHAFYSERARSGCSGHLGG